MSRTAPKGKLRSSHSHVNGLTLLKTVSAAGHFSTSAYGLRNDVNCWKNLTPRGEFWLCLAGLN